MASYNTERGLRKRNNLANATLEELKRITIQNNEDTHVQLGTYKTHYLIPVEWSNDWEYNIRDTINQSQMTLTVSESQPGKFYKKWWKDYIKIKSLCGDTDSYREKVLV